MLQGNGSVKIAGERVLQGEFYEYGKFCSVKMVGGYSKTNKQDLKFSPLREFPLPEFCEAWAFSPNQVNDLLEIKNFCEQAMLFESEYLFPDAMGNWIHCDFNEHGMPVVGVEPIMITNSQKTIIIQEDRAITFDHSKLIFTIVDDFGSNERN